MNAIDDPRLTAAAGRLRSAIDELAAALTSGATVLQDVAQDCDPQQPDRSVCWVYQVSGPRQAQSEHALHTAAERWSADGWSITDRSTDQMVARQLQRGGTDLAVTMSQAPTGDVVVGGSSECVDVDTSTD